MLINRGCRLIVFRVGFNMRYFGKPSSTIDDPDPNTPLGRLDRQPKKVNDKESPVVIKDSEETRKAYAPFPDGMNPKTGEVGGPVGPEPTRYGDWERKGRVTDF